MMKRSDAVIYKGKRRPGLTSHRQRERVVIISISAVILFFLMEGRGACCYGLSCMDSDAERCLVVDMLGRQAGLHPVCLWYMQKQ